jgi:signal transduction histidine kinase
MVVLLTLLISVLHYTTPTSRMHFHLLYMQAYFIPILLAAFWFGVRGGLTASVAVSLIYFPHIMLQWGGWSATNAVRFLQLGLFNAIGYATGRAVSSEHRQVQLYRKTSKELEETLDALKRQQDQLTELEDQLRHNDRLAVVGELTASLAHEIRNPLGSIRGTADILNAELELTPREREFLDILVNETRRMSEVVETYLSFARAPHREHQQYDVGSLVRNTLMLLSSKARKSGIDLEHHVDEILLPVDGDPVELQQILVNLLLNAIQATDQGGRVACLVRANTSASSIEISVIDSGTGIDAARRERIFDPFFSTKPDGTGLGLAIVKRICQKNHWIIDHHSTEGEGTTFVLTLPVEQSALSFETNRKEKRV